MIYDPFLEIYYYDPRNYEPDIFYLAFIWIFATILIDVMITSLINRLRARDKKLSKEVLKNSMVIGAIVATCIWSIQMFVFEVYLKRLLGIVLIEQDIRILFGVVSFVYFMVFYVSLKYKFLPDAISESEQRLKQAQDLMKTEQTIIIEIEIKKDEN